MKVKKKSMGKYSLLIISYFLRVYFVNFCLYFWYCCDNLCLSCFRTGSVTFCDSYLVSQSWILGYRHVFNQEYLHFHIHFQTDFTPTLDVVATFLCDDCIFMLDDTDSCGSSLYDSTDNEASWQPKLSGDTVITSP